jgi:pimeloyl-ACP methyl ester carboxylesterase
VIEVMGWMTGIAIGLSGIVGLGAAYQWVSTKREDSLYPAPGKLIDVGGYRLHIHSTGEGGPAVILDAGGGCNSLDWALVQPEIAKFTQVCSYDRAGFGWSEESPNTRTSQNFVEELHTLLQNSNVPSPYILVGHSLGGLNVRLYASLYPNEVAGVVLVDSAHENQFERYPPPPTSGWLQHFLTNKKICLLMANLGLFRLLYTPMMHKVLHAFPPEIRNAYCAKSNTVASIRAKLEEMDKLKESSQQLKDAGGSIGNKPLIVITAKSLEQNSELYSSSPELKDYIFKISKIHQELQKDLVNKSTESKQIFADSSHMITHEKPEVIVDAVRELVQQVRSQNSI